MPIFSRHLLGFFIIRTLGIIRICISIVSSMLLFFIGAHGTVTVTTSATRCGLLSIVGAHGTICAATSAATGVNLRR